MARDNSRPLQLGALAAGADDDGDAWATALAVALFAAAAVVVAAAAAAAWAARRRTIPAAAPSPAAAVARAAAGPRAPAHAAPRVGAGAGAGADEGPVCNEYLPSSGHGGVPFSRKTEHRPRPGVLPGGYAAAKLAGWGLGAPPACAAGGPQWAGAQWSAPLFRLTTRARLPRGEWLQYDPAARRARFAAEPAAGAPGVAGALDLWRVAQSCATGAVRLRAEGAAQLGHPAELREPPLAPQFAPEGQGTPFALAGGFLAAERGGATLGGAGAELASLPARTTPRAQVARADNYWLFRPEARPLPPGVDEGAVLAVGPDFYQVRDGRRRHLSPAAHLALGAPPPRADVPAAAVRAIDEGPALASAAEALGVSEGDVLAIGYALYVVQGGRRRHVSGEAWARMGFRPEPRTDVPAEAVARLEEGPPLL